MSALIGNKELEVNKDGNRWRKLWTIPEWGPTICVSFDVKILSWTEKWANILRVTKKNSGADGEHGTRYPGVWIRPNYEEEFHICTTLDTNKDHCIQIPVEKDRWYHVTISQKLNKEVGFDIF